MTWPHETRVRWFVSAAASAYNGDFVPRMIAQDNSAVGDNL